MNQRLRVTVDQQADMAYIRLTDGKVARTVELSPEICVDLDDLGVVVGIECFGIDAEMPFSELIRVHHVHSETVEALRQLRPSVGARIVSMAEGSASTARRAVETTTC